LMVFLNFFLDEEKDTHWFRRVERRLSNLASVPAMSVFIALVALLIMAANVDEAKRLVVTMAGIWGIVIYIGVQVLSHMLGGEPEVDENGNAVRHDENGVPTGVVKAGIGGFLYLEVLDASFSFDGVIGDHHAGSGNWCDLCPFNDDLSGGKRHAGCLYLSGTWCALRDWCLGFHYDCQRNRPACTRIGDRSDRCGLYCLGSDCLDSVQEASGSFRQIKCCP